MRDINVFGATLVDMGQLIPSLRRWEFSVDGFIVPRGRHGLEVTDDDILKGEKRCSACT